MKTDRKHIKIIVAIFAASAMMASCNTLVPLLAKIRESFPEQSVSRVQMVFTLTSLVAVPTMLVSSALTRAFSKKALTAVSLLFMFVGGMIPVFVSETFWVLYVAAALIGIGMGILNVMSSALVSDHFKGLDKGRVMGVQSIALSCGSALMSWLSGEIAKAAHWSRAMLVFLIALPLLVVFLLFMPADSRTPIQPSGKAVYNRRLIFFVILTLFWGLLYTSFQTNVAMFIEETGYGDTAFAGVVSAVFMVIGIPCGLLMGPMIKATKSRLLPLAILSAAAGMLCAAFAKGPVPIFVGSLLVGIAFGTYGPASNTAAATMVPAEAAAAGIALMKAVGHFGRFFSPKVLNAVSELFGGGFRKVFLVGGVGLAILGAVFLIFNPVKDEDLL